MKFFMMASFLLLSIGISAQLEIFKEGPVSSGSEKEYQIQYQKNIKKSKINGIYIPRDLDDAFKEIIALAPEDAILNFKGGEELVVAKKLHHGLGKWILMKWNLEEGSRYSHHLKQKGLSFPEDMVQFTIRAFHRHLNNVKLEEEILVKEYTDKRLEEQKERNKNRKVLKEEVRKIPRN